MSAITAKASRKMKKYAVLTREPRCFLGSFDFSWEQRKVGDLLIERNQQAPMSDEYPLMAFIANEGVAPKGERYDRSALVTDTVNKLYKKTEKGDFIYSSNNLETGSIGLNKYGKACISPVYSIFEPTGIADSDFLGRRLVRKDFINAMVKWRQGVIYGQWRIHESDFLKIEIPVPSVEEQRKMPSCLLQGCSNDLIIFRADGGNHFTHYGIFEGMFLIFDVSKDFKEGRLSCYLNNSGDDRPKFKVSDKPLDGYRHFGRLVASMKNYEV